MKSALRIRDVRQNQIQHRAVALGKIRTLPMQADEYESARRLVVSQHAGQLAVYAEGAVEYVVKLGAMKRAAGNDIGQFPGLRGMGE